MSFRSEVRGRMSGGAPHGLPAVGSYPLGDVDEEVAVSCRGFSAVVALNCGNHETRGLEHEQEFGVEVHPHASVCTWLETLARSTHLSARISITSV